jgi:hypothetical protein
MSPIYPHKSVQIWLVRDRALSQFDPMFTALSSMADVATSDALPDPAQLAEYAGMVVLTPATETAGVKQQDIARAVASTQLADPARVLWLVGKVDDSASAASDGFAPIPWSVPLNRLAEFVERL